MCRRWRPQPRGATVGHGPLGLLGDAMLVVLLTQPLHGAEVSCGAASDVGRRASERAIERPWHRAVGPLVAPRRAAPRKALELEGPARGRTKLGCRLRTKVGINAPKHSSGCTDPHTHMHTDIGRAAHTDTKTSGARRETLQALGSWPTKSLLIRNRPCMRTCRTRNRAPPLSTRTILETTNNAAHAVCDNAPFSVLP